MGKSLVIPTKVGIHQLNPTALPPCRMDPRLRGSDDPFCCSNIPTTPLSSYPHHPHHSVVILREGGGSMRWYGQSRR